MKEAVENTMPIVVENGNWGAVSLSAIRAVVESAYAVLVHTFEKEPECIIHISPWNQYPLVAYDRRPYQIYLSARDTYWSQYVYQFSHELCHILTNFDRAKSHRHKWFEESLCELSSIFVLQRLAETWAENPPTGILKAVDFAPSHGKYAKSVEEKYRFVGRNLPGWFAGNIATLETSPEERDLNGIVAVALLKYFRKDPSLWRECGSLNKWDPEKDNSFSEYLDSWSACLSKNGLDNKAANIMRKLFYHTEKSEVQ
ncbi:MAG: hypothetical protein OXC97_04710 [Candidatus Dadabacteria bacterium]|nr:hypothetical protein [Candidatus Dadabacteria bacterium]